MICLIYREEKSAWYSFIFLVFLFNIYKHTLTHRQILGIQFSDIKLLLFILLRTPHTHADAISNNLFLIGFLFSSLSIIGLILVMLLGFLKEFCFNQQNMCRKRHDTTTCCMFLYFNWWQIHLIDCCCFYVAKQKHALCLLMFKRLLLLFANLFKFVCI